MKTLGLLLSLATLSLAMTPLEAAPPGEGGELVISDDVNGATADLDRKKSAATDYDFNAMLQPVPATAKFSDPDFNIWCGSAVQGRRRQVPPLLLALAAEARTPGVGHALRDRPRRQRFAVWPVEASRCRAARARHEFLGRLLHPQPDRDSHRRQVLPLLHGQLRRRRGGQVAQLDASQSPAHRRGGGGFTERPVDSASTSRWWTSARHRFYGRADAATIPAWPCAPKAACSWFTRPLGTRASCPSAVPSCICVATSDQPDRPVQETSPVDLR